MVAILASATVLTAFDASSTAPCLIMSCEMDDASQRAMAFTGFYVQELILFGFWVLFVPSCIFFQIFGGAIVRDKAIVGDRNYCRPFGDLE